VVSAFENCRDVDNFDKDFDFEKWSKDLTDVETIKSMLHDLLKFENNLKQIRNQDTRGMI